jgi:hypothetical protein
MTGDLKGNGMPRVFRPVLPVLAETAGARL